MSYMSQHPAWTLDIVLHSPHSDMTFATEVLTILSILVAAAFSTLARKKGAAGQFCSVTELDAAEGWLGT